MEIRPQSDSSSIRSVSAELPGYGEWMHVAVTIGSGTVLAAIKAALDGIAIENLDDVTVALALPASSGDVQFTRQSSNPAVIGHNGKFTPIEAGVEDVTLTVTASLDGVVLTREFTASVYHHVPDKIINPKYLIASYSVDEADGGAVKDTSGHGRDGRIDGEVELVNGVAMFGGAGVAVAYRKQKG